MSTNVQEIAQRYIASWNETDAPRRRALLTTLWTQDATYVDPIGGACGIDEMNGMIEAVQQRFAGLRFALAGLADGHGNVLRFTWRLGHEGEESLVEGTDFAELEDGRLKRVVGFLDKVPAAA